MVRRSFIICFCLFVVYGCSIKITNCKPSLSGKVDSFNTKTDELFSNNDIDDFFDDIIKDTTIYPKIECRF